MVIEDVKYAFLRKLDDIEQIVQNLDAVKQSLSFVKG